MCRLLLGELYVSREGCCCAKEFLIPKEIPIVITMTSVQSSMAIKPPIFFSVVLTFLVIFKLRILVTLRISIIYIHPGYELNKSLLTSVLSY